MLDFSLKIYQQLLNAIANFPCWTFGSFVKESSPEGIVLRHDVDRLPQNALTIARMQNNKGMRGSFYFRIVPASFDPSIIERIAAMGHEIGYHYEDLALAARAMRKEKGKADRSPQAAGRREGRRQETGDWRQGTGDRYEKELYERAIESFAANLARLRQVADVKTICMHGSPLGRLDNRALWGRYNYRDYGIIGEPYFDIDFDKVAYYTDTGRRWDGGKVSVRDKPRGRETGGRRPETEKSSPQTAGRRGDRRLESGLRSPVSGFPVFHSTFNLIQALKDRTFPIPAMITFHPQRWTDRAAPWLMELVGQRVKNGVKRVVVGRKEKGTGK